MHNEAETQGIVEALAEHDFHEMRLSEMFCASGCSSHYFFAHCHNLLHHIFE